MRSCIKLIQQETDEKFRDFQLFSLHCRIGLKGKLTETSGGDAAGLGIEPGLRGGGQGGRPGWVGSLSRLDRQAEGDKQLEKQARQIHGETV